MTWFKIDDKWHSHPKVVGLSMPARGLWATAGSWCGDQLTDGRVPRALLKVWGASPKLAAELVLAGLWREVEGGWQFHQWLEHQPSREKVETDKARNAERQAAFRKRKEDERNAQVTRYSGTQADESNALRNGGSNGLVTVPRPDPTRPELNPVVPLAPSALGGGLAQEVREGWGEAYFAAGQGVPPKLVGRQLEAAVEFSREVAKAHGKSPREAARAIAAECLRTLAGDARAWGLSRVDPYAAPSAKNAPIFDRSCLK